MGNSNEENAPVQNFNFHLQIIDINFGLVRLLQRKVRPFDYLMRLELDCTQLTSELTEDLVEELHKLKNIKLKSIAQIARIDHQRANWLCSPQEKIVIYQLYLNYSLEELSREHNEAGSSFSEAELWFIMQEVYRTKAEFQANDLNFEFPPLPGIFVDITGQLVLYPTLKLYRYCKQKDALRCYEHNPRPSLLSSLSPYSFGLLMSSLISGRNITQFSQARKVLGASKYRYSSDLLDVLQEILIYPDFDVLEHIVRSRVQVADRLQFVRQDSDPCDRADCFQERIISELRGNNSSIFTQLTRDSRVGGWQIERIKQILRNA